MFHKIRRAGKKGREKKGRGGNTKEGKGMRRESGDLERELCWKYDQRKRWMKAGGSRG